MDYEVEQDGRTDNTNTVLLLSTYREVLWLRYAVSRLEKPIVDNHTVLYFHSTDPQVPQRFSQSFCIDQLLFCSHGRRPKIQHNLGVCVWESNTESYG
ncbi:hypothetical protein BgiBS90_023802 [Biomphalaria glabrata]|nr:hypothetical protein BgiBS90_023802 [Biomphalaria glabrata]